MKNSSRPPYKLSPAGVRFVKINGGWLNTKSIESIMEPPGGGPVVIQTCSGAAIAVPGVYSADALARGMLGPRYDEPDKS